MIYRVALWVLLFVVVACSSSKKSVSSEMITISESDIDAGRALIARSDCFTCHKIEEKLIGPSYLSVAQKYQPTDENVARLSKKILKGGTGTWGDLPMLPHPSTSQDDAGKMVKFILSLKK